LQLYFLYADGSNSSTSNSGSHDGKGGRRGGKFNNIAIPQFSVIIATVFYILQIDPGPLMSRVENTRVEGSTAGGE